MTEGVTEETVEGMSQEKIERTIEALRDGTFRWKPSATGVYPEEKRENAPVGTACWS